MFTYLLGARWVTADVTVQWRHDSGGGGSWRRSGADVWVPAGVAARSCCFVGGDALCPALCATRHRLLRQGIPPPGASKAPPASQNASRKSSGMGDKITKLGEGGTTFSWCLCLKCSKTHVQCTSIQGAPCRNFWVGQICGKRFTNDLYATTLGSATNRKHCVMCVKFNKEWKTMQIWLMAAIEIFYSY